MTRKIPEEVRQSIRDFKYKNPEMTVQQIAECMQHSYNCVLETLRVKRIDSFEDRFWSYVDKSGGPEACWTWKGSLTPSGYGQIRVPELNRPVVASRVSLYLQNGEWPSGDACHKCDNPPCVNPLHLFDGTRKENMQDCSAKGRVKVPGLRGTQNPTGKLTSEDVFHIRTLFHLCKPQDLAKCFGVSRGHIVNVYNGRDRKYD